MSLLKDISGTYFQRLEMYLAEQEEKYNYIDNYIKNNLSNTGEKDNYTMSDQSGFADDFGRETQFFGANSSRYTAASKATGKAIDRQTSMENNEPINELAIPANSASLESAFVKKLALNSLITLPSSFNLSKIFN